MNFTGLLKNLNMNHLQGLRVNVPASRRANAHANGVIADVLADMLAG